MIDLALSEMGEDVSRNDVSDVATPASLFPACRACHMVGEILNQGRRSCFFFNLFI